MAPRVRKNTDPASDADPFEDAQVEAELKAAVDLPDPPAVETAPVADLSGPTDEEQPGPVNEVDITAIHAQLQHDVRNAIHFIQEFQSEREEAQEMYRGKSYVKRDGNRSGYVATVVRDKIRSMKPSVIRTLLSDNPVEFLPNWRTRPEQARQQTMYVNNMFDVCGGYNILSEAVHYAMLQRYGVVQYWWEQTEQFQYRTWPRINAVQLAAMENAGIEITEIKEIDNVVQLMPNGEQVAQPIYEVEARYTDDDTGGKLAMQTVPLHEFFISDEAETTRPPRVIGRQMSITITDALKAYPDLEFDDLVVLNDEEVELHDGMGESSARRRYIPDYETSRLESSADLSMKHVLITEVFYSADLDGDGMASCYKWVLGGTGYELLTYERAEDGHNYAIFQVEPEPNTWRGTSMWDITRNEQEGLTSLMRSILDNAHMSNTPRLGIHENLVNVEDVLNRDIGSPIRFRAPGQIQPIAVPFIGGDTIPLVELWQRDIETKTGVTRASMGLDPDALQSTDKEAVRNTIAQGAGQIELYARNLAETGMTQLFRGILRLCMRHQNPDQVMWITGEQFVPVDPTKFDPTLNIRVNVGLGSGNRDERLAALNLANQMQTALVQQFGPNQPMVMPHNVSNLIEDQLAMMGLKDSSRYFNAVNPQQSAQLVRQMQVAQAAAAQKPDPQIEALREAERIRADAKVYVEEQKNRLSAAEKHVDIEADMAQAEMKDDLERDKMTQGLFIEAAKILQQAIDKREVQRQQESN